MTTVLDAARGKAAADVFSPRPLRLGVLGLGTVGSAVAALAAEHADTETPVSIGSALVRDVDRPRAGAAARVPLTTSAVAVLDSGPDVVVEMLGGIEPARTAILEALSRGLPVVTANKTLLASHGDELQAAAARHQAPLLYEASVLAGVPFLGMFHRRPLARDAFGLAGILNGTSNYILSRMEADRLTLADALAAARRAGYAEPDPVHDVDGTDAVQKLCVLVRHFGGLSVSPESIERAAIGSIEPDDLEQALIFGGRLRPAAAAEWTDDRLTAWAGPAFVRSSHPLAAVGGVQNAILLRTRRSGDLFFSGPGAGPAVTATTLLDDALEAHRYRPAPPRPARPCLTCAGPSTGWFLRLAVSDPCDETEAAGFLSSLGIRPLRVSPVRRRETGSRQWMLIHSCAREHLHAALELWTARKCAVAWAIRAID